MIQQTFDTVEDLAQVLPLSIVLDFIGLPQEGREHMLDWAEATFMLWTHFFPCLTSFSEPLEPMHHPLAPVRQHLSPTSMRESMCLKRKSRLCWVVQLGACEYVQPLGRVLRKVENKEAVLLDIIARKTPDEGKT